MDGRRCGLVLLTALALAGCATSYQRSGLTGGFNERKINASAYVVSFRGNGYTSEDKVWYFWIYRCAELTRQSGYQIFTIRATQAPTAANPGELPGLVANAALASGSGFVKVGHYTAPTIIAIPGSSGSRFWTSSGTVLMFHDLPTEVLWTLDAQKVLDQLRPYVSSDGKAAPPTRTNLYEQALVAHARIDLGPAVAAPANPSASSASQGAGIGSPDSNLQPRSIEDVQRSLDITKLLVLHAFYHDHVLRGADVTSGRLVLSFTVTANGIVQNLHITSSSFSDRVFVAQVSNLVRSTAFGARNVADTHVEIPISFAPMSAS